MLNNRLKWWWGSALVILLAAAFAAGAAFGFYRQTAADSARETVDLSPFWRAWNIIDEKFVATATSTPLPGGQERVWGAIQGLVWSLKDPYSVFLPPAEKKLFEEEINGNFGGVGIEIGVKNGSLTVIAPLESTPAKKAGLLPGDVIIQIDDEMAVNLSIEQAIQRIRGEVGTPVRLKILRDDSETPLDFTLTRAVIQIPTLDSEWLPEGIFLVKLHNFGSPAPVLFREAIRKFTAARGNKLILDLRGNPGGFLEAAVDMAGWFLPVGKAVAIEERGSGAEPRIYRSRGENVFPPNGKMVILIDGGTASAAEILAGALNEHGVASLVGEKTFGKGSVQELVSVTKDSSLKITVARWLTPGGRSLSESGLEPEIAAKSDAALEQAIELLK